MKCNLKFFEHGKSNKYIVFLLHFADSPIFKGHEKQFLIYLFSFCILISHFTISCWSTLSAKIIAKIHFLPNLWLKESYEKAIKCYVNYIYFLIVFLYLISQFRADLHLVPKLLQKYTSCQNYYKNTYGGMDGKYIQSLVILWFIIKL